MSDTRWVDFIRFTTEGRTDKRRIAINKSRVLAVEYTDSCLSLSGKECEPGTKLIMNYGEPIFVLGTFEDVKKKLGASNE